MSNAQNDVYLEQANEAFQSAETVEEKEKIIAILREDGFDEAADTLINALNAEIE